MKTVSNVLNVFMLIVISQFATAAADENAESRLYEIKSAGHYLQTSTPVILPAGTEYSIATHHWSSGNDKLVFMIHGYADSCVYPKPLQRWFLNNSYDVICMELPGHGLSSGTPGMIGEMEDYRQITETVIQHIDFSDYSSLVFYGHSTGNVGMMELLLDDGNHPFDKMVMATPLVRTKHWHLSKFGKNILGWMLPRLNRRDLVDEPEYEALRQKDPDYLDKVPLDFFRAVIRWNKRLKQDTRTSNENLHVIFAGKDRVINTSFNRRFFEEHFLRARFYEIEDSGHILHYSPPETRLEFFDLLGSILGSDAGNEAISDAVREDG